MSCKSPLLRIPGKLAGDFPPHYAKWIRHNDGLVIGQNVLDYVKQYVHLDQLQEIPCGHCVQCYLKRSRDWGARIMLECKEYKHNYFITLTYDDDHLPKLPDNLLGYIDYKGELFNSQLEIKDFQDFMKRFRKFVKSEFDHDGMRIAYCGEYGDLTSRPHFHFVLMNAPDLEPYLQFHRYKNADGERINYYKCPTLDKYWGKGFVDVTNVTFNAAAYVAGYVLKKQYAKDFQAVDVPEGFALRKQPFFKVSNRPGIARKYFEDHHDEIYDTDEIFIKKRFSTMKLKPPRYYDKLFDILEPERMAAIKESRERDVKLATDISHFDYLKASGERLERQQKQKKGRNTEL